MDRSELHRRFSYHAPDPERARLHTMMRENAIAFGLDILEHTSPGREQSLALTHLEEMLFWLNAAIARPAPAGE